MNKVKKITNLIDWESLEIKDPPISSRVDIFCDKCLAKMNMTIDAIYRNALKVKPVRCMSCQVSEALARPEVARKVKEDAKKKKKDKKFHKALSDGQRRRFRDVENRKKMSESLKKYWKSKVTVDTHPRLADPT